MLMFRMLALIGALTIAGGSGVQAQRASSQGVGANPPPVSLPAPARPAPAQSTTPPSASAKTVADAASTGSER